MSDRAEDKILVTVRHPHGDVKVTLSKWMDVGPGPRSYVDVVSAVRAATGAPLPLSVVPIKYRNSRRVRLLRRVKLLPDPWANVPRAVDEPKRFDLYGCRLGSLDEVGRLIESCLGVDLKEHDSSYMGGSYLRADGSLEEIEVVPNLPDGEGYYPDGGFDEWPFLVYVSDSRRWSELDALLASMPSLVHLRTEVVSKPDGASRAGNH